MSILVEDSQLKALVQVLNGVLLKSKAVVTMKKYKMALHTWRKWAMQFKECNFQASSVHVPLFLLTVSCSIIDEVHYGLKWFHDLAGQPNTAHSWFL